MTEVLLDSNVLIRCLRRTPGSLELLRELRASSDLYISVLSRLEVLAWTWPNEEERTLEFLSSLASLPVNQAISDAAGRLIFRQGRQGITLHVPDAILAATALHHRLTLVTCDGRHFEPIPDLRVLSPSEQ